MSFEVALFLVQAFIFVGLPYAIWRLRIVNTYIPLVVIQIITGIILGPSIFGRIFPGGYGELFPSSSIAIISGLSWLAIVLFGFQMGTHFNAKDFKGQGKAFAITSVSSAVTPFILGFIAAWLMLGFYPTLGGPNVSQFRFALALGIAAGVSALPVLGKILKEMKMIHSPLGNRLLGYATVNDGMLWPLLAVLFALSTAAAAGKSADMTVVAEIIIFAILFLLALAFLVRPLLQKLYDRGMLTPNENHGELVVILCLLFISAAVTEWIGIHYLLGAFFFGAIVPKEMVKSLNTKIEPVVDIVLLPFFFIMTGLKTQFDFASTEVWMLFLVMTIVSSIGKILGTAIPAMKYGGHTVKESFMKGSFMQCKGLIEVVVISLHLQYGIIAPVAFSGMLLMTVATTALTKPSVLLVEKYFDKHPAILPEA